MLATLRSRPPHRHGTLRRLKSAVIDGRTSHARGSIRTASTDKDVPARLAAVLWCSNHVLTLRRILHVQPRNDRPGGRIASSGGLYASGTCDCPCCRSAPALSMWSGCSAAVRLCLGCIRRRLEIQDRTTAPARRWSMDSRSFQYAPSLERMLSPQQSISNGGQR